VLVRALGLLGKQRFAYDLGGTWTIAKVDVEGSNPFSRSEDTEVIQAS